MFIRRRRPCSFDVGQLTLLTNRKLHQSPARIVDSESKCLGGREAGGMN
jgi:hypothetical protein